MKWVDPKKRNTKKTLFCMSLQKLFLKYEQNTYNWSGNSRMNPIEAVEYMKRKLFNERKNPEDKYENASDNYKYGSVSETFLTYQGNLF